MASLSARPEIVPRKIDFDFDPETVPRWWFKQNPVLTHAVNGLHVVFPEGERFFIRSVRHYEAQIADPTLQRRVRGFFGQEARHGHEHTRSFEMLRQQGYDMSDFLEHYSKSIRSLERWAPPILRLSVTVALEHLTAALGANALVDPYLENMHPTMRALLRWHAAEEIEHKSVAYDVYTAAGGGYFVRISGMAVGYALLMFFWGRAMRQLFRMEALPRQEFVRFRTEARNDRPGLLRRLFKPAVLEYLKPGFHPDQRDNYHLAASYLAQLQRDGVA